LWIYDWERKERGGKGSSPEGGEGLGGGVEVRGSHEKGGVHEKNHPGEKEDCLGNREASADRTLRETGSLTDGAIWFKEPIRSQENKRNELYRWYQGHLQGGMVLEKVEKRERKNHNQTSRGGIVREENG